MLGDKNPMQPMQQTAAPPAPPAYLQSQPQWTPNSNSPQNMASLAQVGEQYRSAQFAKCAQGDHARERKFGICGIITAVACFPIGLICLFMDSKQVCSRCGQILEQ